jgi:hypothetical protein
MIAQIDRFINTGFRRKVDVDSILELELTFGDFVAHFNEMELFDGPSSYFHGKTMRLLEEHQCIIADAIEDNDYVEALYATLATWGLHRVGNGANEMIDRDQFVQLLEQLEPLVRPFEDLHLAELAPDLSETSRVKADEVADQLWAIIETIQIANNNARLVAGTKLLHHLLPNLVPPMDRRYTLNFFYDNNNLNGRTSERSAFKQLFRSFFVIAYLCQEEIEGIREGGNAFRMNTSFTKVLDNAIVGAFPN